MLLSNVAFFFLLFIRCLHHYTANLGSSQQGGGTSFTTLLMACVPFLVLYHCTLASLSLDVSPLSLHCVLCMLSCVGAPFAHASCIRVCLFSFPCSSALVHSLFFLYPIICALCIPSLILLVLSHLHRLWFPLCLHQSTGDDVFGPSSGAC